MKVLAVLLVVSFAACRTMLRQPPDSPPPQPPAQTEREPSAPDQAPSAEVAAIIDSIRAVVRDSIEAAANDSVAARTAREEVLAAARRDSIAASLRRDSVAAVVRRDSIAAAARVTIAAVARRDSVAAAFRADSIAAALQDSLVAIARRDSIAAAIAEARAAEPISEDLEQLRELGPAYIPYDEGPRAVWDTESQANVTKALLPVVRTEDLVARTRTYFWLLVRADGTVDQAVLQTSSGSAMFDAAAQDVATGLLFRPAMRGGRAVPTWVIRDISLVM